MRGGAAAGRPLTLVKTEGEGPVRPRGKVVGYVKRHLAQRPEGDVTGTDWRNSLMSWGHDPKK